VTLDEKHAQRPGACFFCPDFLSQSLICDILVSAKNNNDRRMHVSYLHGDIQFQFENFREKAPVRFVYSCANRTIVLAQVCVQGHYHDLKEMFIAELEAGILSFDGEFPSIEESESMPTWASARLELA
jgi:hypothetical protein